MTLPNVFSFYVNGPELPEQRAMAAALGYGVNEALVIPSYYVTWRKLNRPAARAPEVGELWVDVSRHNWPIDVKAFKAAGVKCVYARATLGANGVDDRWVDIRNAVLAEGLDLGAYHYFIWNEDGARQADNFKRVTLDFCTRGPVVDCERRRNVPTSDPAVFLPEAVERATASANLLTLLNGIGQPDEETAGLYTSKVEWEAMFSLSAESVSRWWKWVAHYRNGAARWDWPADAHELAVPAGWQPRVHQYRVAAAGELPWHPRALDLNRFLGDDFTIPATAPVEPAPWWHAWPDGAYTLPGRPLAIPNRVMQFYTEHGVALLTRNVTWTMWVVEKRGDLLKVFDQQEPLVDWWVRASEVSPA